MKKTPISKEIPTRLTIKQFTEFILPHLPPPPRRGRKRKLCWYALINYILLFLHTGCQWKQLPINRNERGEPEIHYTRIRAAFAMLTAMGVMAAILAASIAALAKAGLLDLSVIHGDGTSTAAKKGGDNIGRNGHKHHKGDKVVAFCDRNCNVIAPFIAAPGNRNETVLFVDAFTQVKSIARRVGLDLSATIVSLDGGYDSAGNRKAIFNAGMIPNIRENRRGRKKVKRGRKRLYDPKIFKERFRTIERVFAWEDKFKRLLLRFERISELHYGLKMLAYAMINLRHFCTT